MQRLSVATLAALTLMTAPSVSAQEKPLVNVQIFRPSAHPGDLFNTKGSDIESHGTWTAGMLVNYGAGALVYEDQSKVNEEFDEVISDQLTLDLMGSFALVDWVDIALEIPLHIMNKGDAAGFTNYGPIDGFAIGDIRLSTKVKILAREKEDEGFGLAADLNLGLPTGDKEAFVSDGFTILPTLLADFKASGLTVMANLGYRIRLESDVNLYLDEIPVGSELDWRLGVGYDALPEELQVIGELHGSASDFEAATTNIEGVLGMKYALKDLGLNFSFGVGAGFTTGYGNTKFRVLGGVGYGVPGISDADEDGFLDEVDKCPNDPEDKDGFEDDDGCPEDDNDKDGIKDTDDKCPLEPEDADNFQDEDGCPDPDNDGDGVLDGTDKCPSDLEDKDGFEDTDGCPDPDNDKDGIADTDDKCPNKAENKNDFEDDDGCPDEKLAKVVKGKIVIMDKVFFKSGKSKIQKKSYPLLEAVTRILNANPDIKKVRVEGHTDDKGNDKKNLKLSKARAKAVKNFLISKGVDAGRLIDDGFGETKPIEVCKRKGKKKCRANNRRVEFVIVGS